MEQRTDRIIKKHLRSAIDQQEKRIIKEGKKLKKTDQKFGASDTTRFFFAPPSMVVDDLETIVLQSTDTKPFTITSTSVHPR